MLSFSSLLRMAVYIGTMLHFLTFSSLEHERGPALPLIETIQQINLMHSAMRPLITVSLPDGASVLCRSPCISICVTFPHHTSSILRCLGSMLPSIRHSLRL